ncbi:MAG: LCP family protein [Acidimicrobiales bacterium]|nr:LCP family protein [Acidimicrobiales bacterium]
MTDEDASLPDDQSRDDADADADRAARLAALLSVDISPRSGPSVDDVGAVEVEVATDDVETADALGELATPVGTGDAATTGAPETRSGPSRWQRVLAGTVLVVLLGIGVALAYAGTRIVRSSTEGEVLTPVDDPEAPGYEAVVDPTATMVVMHDVDGLIDAITVLTLPDPDGTGGGVLMVPARTVADVPLYDESPLEIAYDLGDPDLQTQAVGELLGAAMLESTVVDAERWADLVAPVAPLEIDNPNELSIDGEVRFPPGPIELEAEDVGPYLHATLDGESDLARLFRHELFWQAWLDAVAADGSPEAVPGELQSGIGRFVRTLAPGRIVIETLPVQPAAPGRFGDAPAFVPRADRMENLVSRMIPFPRSPADGERARVRVLNGTTDTSVAASIAADLPPAGVEVVIVGNAASLDVEQTTIAHFGEEYRDEAEEIADILGAGRVVEEDRPSDSADITVTLGADL